MGEFFNKGFKDEDNLSLQFSGEEKSRKGFIGETTDIITYPDGTQEIIKSHNVVVNDISKLLAAFIKHEQGYTDGNLYWAVGTGASNWDNNPYTPVDTNTKLVNEVFRKPITVRNFTNANGDVVNYVTPYLELSVVIESDEANGFSLREFGIFGGNATSAKDSGLMINHKAHARIDKVEGMRIERSVRFSF